MLSLSWVGEGYDWDATRVVVGFVVAALLLAAFIPVELRATEPVIPLSLFKSRVFTSSALLMLMVGIGMFGIILYTPLFVQGVLGKTATGSGTVLTPLVLTMTAMGAVAGQVIARVKRIKPFMIFGAIVMAIGIYLLTTLDTNSTQTTVALYLMITGLGLGPLMPTATLAVQSTVEKSLLGVATSATQFIRSLGSTIGTAVIGSLVTSGYADYLKDNTPPQAPGRLMGALQEPNALVSDEARDALDRVASAFPGGEQLVNQILQVAREGLSNSIHDGFVFTLVAVSFAIVAAVLMKNIRLEALATKSLEEGAPDSALAGALETDARSHEDRDLARFLRSADLSADPNPEEATALRGIADRIEGCNGDYPALRSAAAGLSTGHEGSEHERAVHASRTVIRPLAAGNGRNEPASPA
ncbi:MAG TPA: MFS transporter [Rubrobacter sp.]|nr:MFS transporter [Rubrobacter sp.]